MEFNYLLALIIVFPIIFGIGIQVFTLQFLGENMIKKNLFTIIVLSIVFNYFLCLAFILFYILTALIAIKEKKPFLETLKEL